MIWHNKMYLFLNTLLSVAEETKPVLSEKQKKKAAKARADKQRENAKKNNNAHLDNLPEEIKAQIAKFNAPVSEAPVTEG